MGTHRGFRREGKARPLEPGRGEVSPPANPDGSQRKPGSEEIRDDLISIAPRTERCNGSPADFNALNTMNETNYTNETNEI